MQHSLILDSLSPKLPVIQGGMGVGISLHQLAGHVALAGGIGIISSAQIGYKEDDFLINPLQANLRALKDEITKARAIAPSGIIGVNIMVALTHYEEMVKKAVESGADLIISGAGLPVNLPAFTKGSSVKIAPVISSAKAASVICKLWDRKHHTAPDLIIIEGPLAGGHLGFSLDEIRQNPDVLEIIKDVKIIVSEYERKYDKKIPLIAAGGIYTGEDVSHALKSGADGVQMATRFVTTYECDAPSSYKQTYLQASISDIGVIKSPVGMPGRAILNKFIKNTPGNKACFYHCLDHCGITNIPYCISKALIAAVTDDIEHALLFCGQNAYRAQKLEHVQDIFNEIENSLEIK